MAQILLENNNNNNVTGRSTLPHVKGHGCLKLCHFITFCLQILNSQKYVEIRFRIDGFPQFLFGISCTNHATAEGK